ncbi:MAG: hypothetical protein HYU97_11745 [Deltaproteobacteria bacterium]|nr:hypothetical protein [Deltaproteobacteria bacterium]
MKTRNILKLFSFLIILPWLLALGPCDNGELPGDPLDPEDSTTSKAPTPAPSASQEPEPTPIPTVTPESEEVEIASLSVIDETGKKVSTLSNLTVGKTLKLKVQITFDDGTKQLVTSTYNGESITWKSTAPGVLQKLATAGYFKVKGEGVSYVVVEHPEFKATAKVDI